MLGDMAWAVDAMARGRSDSLAAPQPFELLEDFEFSPAESR